MPDDVLTTTTESGSLLELLLDELKAQILAASARSQPVDGLWQQYVGLYLEDQDHPEELARSSAELTGLAREIVGSLVVPVPGIDVALTREQLEAILTGRDQPSTDPSHQTIHLSSEPVMTFSGQFVHAAADIHIDGAGIDFVFRRVYKNQIRYAGPLGFNWDHSYNLWLRIANDTVFRATGVLRQDVYLRHPKFGQAGFNYWVPPDGEHGILLEQADSFVWRSPVGDRYTYGLDPARPFLHRLARIEDRHGNALVFDYADGRLATVAVNHPARLVRFQHDDQDRIIAVSDYTGRVWRYEYDDLGDLVSATTPATDRYRTGLTTSYLYTSAGLAPGPLHNLVQIVDPGGKPYLENAYGIDEADLSFNRVVSQRQGDGETTFEYQRVVQEFDFEYNDMERPTFQALVMEPNGQPVHYVHNRFGHLLLREEDLFERGRISRVQWRYRYNGDGAVIGVLSPEGAMAQRYFGRDDYVRRRRITDADVRTDDHLTAAARQAFGNLLVSVRRGIRFDFASLDLSHGVWGNVFPDVFAPSVGLDPSPDVITKFTYEPTYQQLETSSDPRFTRSADPDDTETPRYRQTLTRYEFTGPAGDASRLLARIRLPDLHLPDGSRLENLAAEFIAYDDRGRWLRRVDPDGMVLQRSYFPADGVREGYLKSETVDPDGLAVTTSYEVNDVGVRTAIVNPRGLHTELEVNELDQIVGTVTAPPLKFQTRYGYDRTGRLENVQRDLRDPDGQPFAGGVEVTACTYDERGNRLAESIGGLDLASRLTTSWRYDPSGERIRTILPNGNQAVRTLDDRHLERTLIRGAGTREASTSHRAYSFDGLLTETVDGAGATTRYTIDALGRWIATVDPLGHITRMNYDKAGNPIVERFFELQPDGSYRLLSRSESEYDELNRLIAERSNLFRDPLVATDPATDFLASPGPGSSETTLFFRDPAGRIVKTVDRNGREATVEFDAAGRRIAERDALGNTVRYTYDANANVTRMDQHEQVIDPASGAVLREDVFSTLIDYDELDRRSAVTDGLGNTTRLRYDSRDATVSVVDPIGAVTRYDYDVYGRCVIESAALAANLPPATLRAEFDKNANVIALVDPGGARTTQEFDALDRRTVVRNADGTEQRFGHDAEDRVTLYVDNNGMRRHTSYDQRGQVVRIAVDTSTLAPGVLIGGATFEAYEYDGLQRVTRADNDFASVRRKPDSLGRIVEETVTYTLPGAPNPRVLIIERTFDALGMLIRIRYPGGRTIRYHLDALHRVERVENTAKGVGYPGSPTLPETYDVLRNHFRGLRRSRRVLGNGAGTSYAYDQAGHRIEIAHRAAAGSDRLVLQQLFDGGGNLRLRRELTAASISDDAFTYNLASWLTEVGPVAAPPRFDPASFAPPAAPLPRNLLTGQSMMDRVIRSAAPSRAQLSYIYDADGNRLREQQVATPPVEYTTNDLNEYTTVAGETLEYDANGNLLREGGRRFGYDYYNQLVRVRDESAGQDLLRLFHDTYGRRIGSLAGGMTLHLLYDGPNVIEEYRDGTLAAQYVHEHALDAPVQISADHSDHWYHADLVRSTRRLSDPTGAFDAGYQYGPFGQPTAEGAAAMVNPNLFHGRRFERAIGLYDYRSRHYSPRLGRFLQRDAVYAPNPYLFVGNNPLVNVDPSGRERESVSTGSGVIRSVSPVEAITPTETPSQAARVAPPEIQRLGDGDCNPVAQSCEPTSRPLISGLVSSPPGNPVQQFVEASAAAERFAFKDFRARAETHHRIEISATQGGLAGAGIIARAGASIASMQAEGEIIEAGLGALGKAAGPLGRLLLRETPAMVEAENLAARAVRLAPAARPALTRSTDATLMALRDQATRWTRTLGVTDPTRFGNINDELFKLFVKDAINRGLLPSTLRVAPRFKYGVDVWDAATGVGWDLMKPTVRAVAEHDAYIYPVGKAMLDGTRITDVRPLVYTIEPLHPW